MVALSHVTSELVSAGVLGTWTTVVRHQSSSSANNGSGPPRTAYSARVLPPRRRGRGLKLSHSLIVARLHVQISK